MARPKSSKIIRVYGHFASSVVDRLGNRTGQNIMIIDKTTGKGCAWSLAAKTITKKLIADGIVGEIIAKSSFRKRCVLLQVIGYGEDQVFIKWSFADKLEKESLWTPSFIDSKIWERAASKFDVDGKLEKSVLNYLLPEMDEYLQSIPDTELVSITREFLIEHGVINTPIQQHNGKTYYFDENEIYSMDKGAKLFPYEGRMKFNIFKIRGTDFFKTSVWRKAASQFEIGMTLENCIVIFLKTKLTYKAPQELSPIDRLVHYIAPPIYERNPENGNEATFDRIRVTVSLPCTYFNSWDVLRDEVKKYQGEIYQQVVHKIEKDRRFKKYSIPMSLVKISNIILLRDFSIDFIFEPKEQKMNPLLDIEN